MRSSGAPRGATAAARRPGGALRHRSGAGEPPRRDRGRRGRRARRERHEGRARGDDRARARSTSGRRARSRPRVSLLRARRAAAEDSPLPAVFDRSRARPRPSSRSCSSRPTTDPCRLPRQPERPGRLPRRSAPLRATVDGRERDREGARRPPRRSLRSSHAGRPRRAHLPEVADASTQIEGGIATNVVPDRVVANINFRYAPDRSPSSADALPPRASCPRVRATARRNSPPAPCCHRLRARPAVAERRRPRARAQAGVDERRRLHLARDRRRQLRTRCDAVRPPARRAGRDRRARAVVRGALGLRHG